MTMISVAAMRCGFEKGDKLKIERDSLRALQAFTHWKMARRSRTLVWISAVGRSRMLIYIPRVIMAMTLPRSVMRMRLARPIKSPLCCSRVLLCVGSMARAMSRKPSVTRLSQRIWPGRRGRGRFVRTVTVKTKATPILVEKR